MTSLHSLTFSGKYLYGTYFVQDYKMSLCRSDDDFAKYFCPVLMGVEYYTIFPLRQ